MFAKRTELLKASEVRELLKLTGKAEIISFGGGLPAEESFPVEEMREICDEILRDCGAKSMQYAVSEGYAGLRENIRELMGQKGIYVNSEDILITTGSQQGLDLTAKVFLDEGDTVLCESPTYLSAINAFKPFYPRFAEVEMDEDGLVPEALIRRLEENSRVKLLYTVPDYQNPTGRRMSLERRRAIAEIANEYDFIIIEDNPYSELCFDNIKLPPIKSFDTQGRVVYLSTFSKTVCPGYRVGWACASPGIINKYVLFKQGTDIHTNYFAQMQIARYLEKYDIQAHIRSNVQIYKSRRDAMLDTIEKTFPREVTYTRPEGGMFLWVTLPEEVNTKVLLKKSLRRGVAFVQGSAFFPNGGHENTMRLNFSGLSEEKIIKGISILGELLKEELSLA
ncbi:2-aminoadipate transaminase [Ruminiclostridium hungatei]|uniref:2-aminoadipate transaminase n=1 Tax=Ruminiclostridium hungatei TaxID=48256 RepID=A0A1V4SDI2_RUMHU|nr:PLP-dependent aminotransferase family protein [Ruminiclostridium hungatei]OPX41979.1 2-aminoadipate transaminase [Ruminiclostridium hungatei]